VDLGLADDLNGELETLKQSEDGLFIDIEYSKEHPMTVFFKVETLMRKHRSKPFNPNIANGFFRVGFIETWGRGIEKICEA